MVRNLNTQSERTLDPKPQIHLNEHEFKRVWKEATVRGKYSIYYLDEIFTFSPSSESFL